LTFAPNCLLEDWRQRLKDFHSQVKLVRGAYDHDRLAPALGLLV
jgi:hypothetical protein